MDKRVANVFCAHGIVLVDDVFDDEMITGGRMASAEAGSFNPPDGCC